MTNTPPPRGPSPAATPDAVSVVSAYGAFRLLLGLLAAWSFFAGFALFVGAIDFDDAGPADRLIGAQMIVLSPVYGLLAWRRSEYRLLLWIPYAVQIGFIVPLGWALLTGDINSDAGPLLLIVSIIFLALLMYVWLSSHPTQFFAADDEEEEEDDEALPDDDEDDDAADLEPDPDPSGRARRYRRL